MESQPFLIEPGPEITRPKSSYRYASKKKPQCQLFPAGPNAVRGCQVYMPGAHSKGLPSFFPLPDEVEVSDKQQVSAVQQVAGGKGFTPGNGKRQDGGKKQHGKKQATIIDDGPQSAPQTASSQVITTCVCITIYLDKIHS